MTWPLYLSLSGPEQYSLGLGIHSQIWHMEPDGVWPATRRSAMLANTAVVADAMAAAQHAIDEGGSIANAVQLAHDVFSMHYEGPDQ